MDFTLAKGMKKLHWYGDLHLHGEPPEQRARLPMSVRSGLEGVFGHPVPDLYWEFLRDHHGDSPLEGESSHFEMGGLGALLSPDPYVGENIFCACNGFTRGIIPFSLDGGGNYFCFDYRNLTEGAGPRIVFWFHELDGDDAFFAVANTFEEFIESLYIPEDTLEDLRDQGMLPDDLNNEQC